MQNNDNAVFDRIMRNGKRLGDCQVGELCAMSEKAAKSAERNLHKARRVEKATQVLAPLSDAGWAQVKCDEERRRAQHVSYRDLAKRYRELREAR
jgi:hypothetical protein